MNILMIHLISFIFLSIILLGLNEKELLKKMFIVLITIQCIVIVGFRDISVGVDTYRYANHFYNTLENVSYILDKNDKGYYLLQKVMGTLLFNNFNIWLIFVSVVIYVSLGVVIYKYSKNIFLSYLIYFSFEFFFFNFSGIRQSLAIACVLLSYFFIVEKKAWKFIGLIILAASFHSTAIIFLPMYWLARKKITKIYLILLTLFLIAVYIMRNRLGEFLTLLYYDGSDVALQLYATSTGIGGTSVFIILVLLMGYFFYNPTNFLKDNQIIILTNILLISLLMQLMSGFSYLFTRLNLYFLIFLILYLPYIISKIGQGNIKMNKNEAQVIKLIINFVFFIFFVGFYLYKVLNGLDAVLPYNFFWS